MDQRRKNARKLAFIILMACSIAGAEASAQQVSFSGRDDHAIYAITLKDLLRLNSSGFIFPDRIYINGNVLKVIAEFMGQDTTPSAVKKTWLTPEWSFVKDANTPDNNKNNALIKLRRLDLDAKAFNPQRNSPINMIFSPVIYSSDRNRAVVIYCRVGLSETFETFVYYFKKQNGVWSLVNMQVPYLS